MEQLSKKEFDRLCKTKKPIYIADEVDTKGNHWSVWRFDGVKGEYKQLEVLDG